MRESIHALRCDFLCLQDTQSERTRWTGRGKPVLINPRRACTARVTVLSSYISVSVLPSDFKKTIFIKLLRSKVML